MKATRPTTKRLVIGLRYQINELRYFVHIQKDIYHVKCINSTRFKQKLSKKREAIDIKRQKKTYFLI